MSDDDKREQLRREGLLDPPRRKLDRNLGTILMLVLAGLLVVVVIFSAVYIN
jgi:hypothetical protein